MAFATRVNGPAIIRVGLQGTGQVDALSDVGITENGPNIEIEWLDEPVQADNAGPRLEADVQHMGKRARIRFALPIYDLTVLTTWILSHAAGNAEGNMLAAGTLIFASGRGFRLILSSPTDAQPWRFFFVRVVSAGLRPGTKYNIYDVVCEAIPYVGVAATSANTPFYDHTNG
jgi:hypothetical protein